MSSFIAKNGKRFDVVDQFSLSQFDESRMMYFVNELDGIIDNLYKRLKTSYPEMKDWYGEKYRERLININSRIREFNGQIDVNVYKGGLRYLNERPILIYIDSESANAPCGEIVGICLMKDTPIEEKLCTLWVDPAYRNIGIGSDMIKRSHGILPYKDNALPFITISGTSMQECPYIAHFLTEYGYIFSGIEASEDKPLEYYYRFDRTPSEILSNIISNKLKDEEVAFNVEMAAASCI